MRGLMYRIWLTIINIFFPPLAVAMLCGFEWDCMLNCVLFLCAVFPSHIHGFYISCTYFHRRHKVKKGRWPGGPKSMIHSSNVINGGASNAEAARLYRKERGLDDSEKLSRRSSGQRPEMAHRQSARPSRQTSYQGGASFGREDQLGRIGTNHSRLSKRNTRPAAYRSATGEHTAQDGYGMPQRR